MAEEKRVRAEKKAKRDEQTRATKDAVKQKQNEKTIEERPVLEWLKVKGYAPEEVKTIGKAHMVAAFEANKNAISEKVRKGGDKITKATPIKHMVQLFKKYGVMAMFP